MNHRMSAVYERPKGIQKIRNLPDEALGALWESIVVDEDMKRRLLSQAVLNFTIRGKVPRTVVPLHGVIMLTGLPGTGKTSLARGLAHRVATSFRRTGFRLLEVEPHSLASAAHGKTQRAVTDLFSQAIAEAASTGPTIVLLDEVETLAADRAKLSLDANPIDVHRATDAVLVQLDALAEEHSNLLFIATSNFPQAVDEAFLSRCDLILEVPLPGRDACERIIKDCLVGFAAVYPAIGNLVEARGITECAASCVGLDGRAIRKMIVNALAADPQTAMNPERLTMTALQTAAQMARETRVKERSK
ncbi:MAG: AAA family ATPase [Gammaproteobacteria bacterium]|nr:AAA family ATPase [Gammaproteobacteria bacterium]